MGKSRDVFGEEIKIFNAIIQRAKKVGAGKDFFQRLAFEDGALERAVHSVNSWLPPATPATLKIARQILGRDKVISASQVAEIWDCSSEVDSRTPIRYHESTLRQCAEENQRGRDWRLLYVFGRTLHELHKMQCAADTGYFPTDLWWACKEEDFWTKDVSKSQAVDGYLLIDFDPAYAEFSVVNGASDQLGFFVDKSEVKCPCSAGLFAEAIATVHLHSGENLACTWKHWAGCVNYPDGARAHIFVSTGDGDDGIHVEREVVVHEKPRTITLARSSRYDF